MCDNFIFIPEDQAVGLSTFTIMAGLGGTFGSVMCAIDWGYLGKINNAANTTIVHAFQTEVYRIQFSIHR